MRRLAEMLGVGEGVLYERQRVLIKSGILEQTPGRGPGSGVRFSARNVALLLLSVLGSSTISNAPSAVKSLSEATSLDGTSLADRLAECLQESSESVKLTGIQISWLSGICTLFLEDKEGVPREETFESRNRLHSRQYDVITQMKLSGLAVSVKETLALCGTNRSDREPRIRA